MAFASLSFFFGFLIENLLLTRPSSSSSAGGGEVAAAVAVPGSLLGGETPFSCFVLTLSFLVFLIENRFLPREMESSELKLPLSTTGDFSRALFICDEDFFSS